MEELRIDAAGHHAQLRGLEAVVDELAAVRFRRHEDRSALLVEPAQVLPGQIGQVVVLRQVPNVLHEVGARDARSPQAQQPGGGQAGQPIGPGVEIIKSLKRCRSIYSKTSRKGGKASICDSYSGSGKVPHRLEILQIDLGTYCRERTGGHRSLPLTGPLLSPFRKEGGGFQTGSRSPCGLPCW